ncbi:MAG TPA: hypothetical protein VGI58_09795 [Streptosporangiaceae bacterium]|jgi:hypothetical protein
MTSAALAHRGRFTGFLLILLGAWGALIPFVGPYIGFAYTPDKAWAYTSGRLWLSVLPGAAAFLGGLLVLGSDRAAGAGAFLAVLGGAWFVVGQPVTAFAITNSSISPGFPVASHGAVFGPAAMHFLESLAFFYGLGVVILFLAALSLGEVAVAKMAARRFGERTDHTQGGFDRTDEFGGVF